MMISVAFLACMVSLLSKGTCGETSAPSSSVMVRKDVNVLSQDEQKQVKGALRRMQQDTGRCSFEYLGSFHGASPMCKSHDHHKKECSIHAKYTFPHWHRLYVVQYEQCLKQHGQGIGVGYWDFTSPGRGLPLLVTGEDNPFSSYTIKFDGRKTVREPVEALFDSNNAEGTSLVYQLTLTVLEQRDYCSFENYIASLHNALHVMIGGNNAHSLSSIEYAAYDPIFMFLHSNFDRVWIVWQELQKLRGLPYDATVCEGMPVHETLHPFDDPEINIIALTRDNCFSGSITDHRHLNYSYDTLAINNHTVEQLDEIIKRRQSDIRVYLGQANFGGQPLRTETFVLNDAGKEFPAGTNLMMGYCKVVSWYNQPLFKFDITNAVQHAGVPLDENIKFHFIVETYNLSSVADVTDYAIFHVREPNTDYEIINIPIGLSYQLPPEIEVSKNTHVRFLPVSAKYYVPIVDLMNNIDFQTCTFHQSSLRSYAVNVIHSLEPVKYYFASSNKEACDDGKKISLNVQQY